jgi:subtilase family serine protease
MSLSLARYALLAATAVALSANPSFAGNHRPHSFVIQKVDVSPSATAVFQCETRSFNVADNGGAVACYGPAAMRAAYGLTDLLNAGLNGMGRTIVILDAFGSPTALQDLQAFDAAFGIPDPPSFNVVTMPGTPAFDSTNTDQVGWATEVSLDVQWAHAIAPGAKIVLVVAASDSDQDMLDALNRAVDKKLGDVISMSFGESEVFLSDPAGLQMIAKWEKALKRAREQHITVFASSGDQGSTNIADDFGDVFNFANVSYPASSPNVTAVGGTNLFFGANGHADPNGSYIGETVWNDQAQGIDAAGGGGFSAIFGRPGFQDKLAAAGHRSMLKRGIPDVAYSAGVVGGVVVHLGPWFAGVDMFVVVGGTSAGPPQWAGIVADVNQAFGRSLGFMNNRLYRLGDRGLRERELHGKQAQRVLFHDTDITDGNNGFCFFTFPDGAFACVAGYSAGAGWDAATGWGTPNLSKLLTMLNELDEDGDDDPR